MKNWAIKFHNNRIDFLFYLNFFCFSFLIFIFHYLIVGQAVYGDGVGYFAHLHSFVIDHDFNYTNEYRHGYSPINNNSLRPIQSDTVQIVALNNKGEAENHYSPGPAILLLPFYVLAHLLTLSINAVGGALPTHGYSDLYQVMTGLGAVIYGILGLIILEKIIKSSLSLSDSFAKLTIASLYLSTNLLFYLSYDVINSHFASFFLTNLFIYLAWIKKEKSTLILAIVSSLIFMTRLQDVLIVLLYIADRFVRGNSEEKSLLGFGLWIMKYGLGMLFFSSPIFYQWYKVFDNPLAHRYVLNLFVTYGNGQGINWLGSLFSFQNGLFTTTPILLIIFNLVIINFIFRKLTKLENILLLFFICQFFIITFQAGWQAASYGGRMYISSLPLFGLGLARLLMLLNQKKVQLIIVGTFILINLFSMSKFIVFTKEASGNSRGLELVTQQKIKQLIPSWIYPKMFGDK